MKPAGSGGERNDMTAPEIVRRAHGVQIQAELSSRRAFPRQPQGCWWQCR
jgi:hypothetical protein